MNESIQIKPGKERWFVKTGTDASAKDVDIQDPKNGTIAELVALPAPRDPDKVPDRDGPTELTVYELKCTLIAYKEEKDGDFHLVLSDEEGHTMIAEIPYPGFCKESIWVDQITVARKAFDTKFHKSLDKLRELASVSEGVPMITKVSVPVTVQGVAFFDKLHGQTGVAPNGIELHPVLSIEFE